MNKILVELYLPALMKSFDVWLPRQLSVYQATQLMICILEEKDIGGFRVNDSTVLCNGDTGEILNINISLETMRLQDGARLMLI